jgi:peptidylprolyl isomerase
MQHIKNKSNGKKQIMTQNMLQKTIKTLAFISIAASSLLARDITLQELEIYAGENYRVEYAKLKEEDKAKIEAEYRDKINLASIIRKQKENDSIYQAALDFRALDLWTKQIASKTDLTDGVLKELYSKQEIKVATKYKLRNILVKEESDADAVLEELLKLDGEKLLKRFGELVKEKSLDKATKEREGDSGWLDMSMLPKEIIDSIKDKPKLSLVKLPVIKDVGTQVVLIEDSQAEHIASFEEAKEYLKQMVISMAITKEAAKLLEPPKEKESSKQSKKKKQ